jgi:hypothetical protein
VARAVCPDCRELVEIQPTGKRIAIGWSAQWWRLIDHTVDVRYSASGVVIAEHCDGSGKRV